MVNTEVLTRIPLFASLGSDALAEIARWFTPRSVSAGTEVAGEGAAGYSFYVLTGGRGTVSSGGATIAQLGPGDFFGEAAIVSDGRRHATVTITEPSELLVMFGTEFRRLQQAHPEVAARIEEIAQERLSAAAE